MTDVSLKSLGTADRSWRGKLRACRIICNSAKPQQVQHNDAAGDPARYKCLPQFLGRGQVVSISVFFGQRAAFLSAVESTPDLLKTRGPFVT